MSRAPLLTPPLRLVGVEGVGEEGEEDARVAGYVEAEADTVVMTLCRIDRKH